MNIPVETKPALWGIAGGAVAAAIIGFTWGGWVTGSTAEASAVQRSNAAVVVALAPLCVEKFQRGADVPGTLAALKKADSWSQGDYIEKGGWAALPGSNSPQQLSAVAKACAELLAARLTLYPRCRRATSRGTSRRAVSAARARSARGARATPT